MAARHLVALDVDYRRLRGEEPTADDYREIDSLDPRWLKSLCIAASSPSGSNGSTPSSCARVQLPKGAEIGDYVVGDLIGFGGMGAVYEATHVAMRRRVAIKVIGSQEASPLEVERFRREAQAAARLSHPNVVRAYDAGEQEGLLYLAMELIDGENLEQRVVRSGPLSVTESVEVVRQAALGLAHAHDQELVHRDVKPSNLVITRSGEVKVLDLGLARLAEPTQLPLSEASQTVPAASSAGGTLSGDLLGTIDYVAPEQAIDPSAASHAVDIYALGCTWGYLLTGESLFGHLPSGQRLIAHQVGEVAPLRGRRPDLPKGLDRLLQSMVAKRVEERPASMLEVVNALDAYRSERAQRNGNGRARWGLAPLFVVVLLLGFAFTSRESGYDAAPPPRDLSVAERAALQSTAAAQQGLPLRRTGVAETRLVLVPAGEFLMGTKDPPSPPILKEHPEYPQHPVTISRPYYLAENETTCGQYQRFVSATGYQTMPERKGGWAWGVKNGVWRQGAYTWRQLGDYQPEDDHPVTNLTWHDAVAYCLWLTAESGDGLRYRLPTEAEWEYACRAESVSRWEFGDEEPLLDEFAWYLANAGRTPKPVAAKQPNAWGLHDMYGNVAEWCLDQTSEAERFYDSAAKTDPAGSESGPLRVQRGGNCLSLPDEVRSASRAHQPAENPTRGGFRVAAELP
ncbi:bifunctional serine/threonine-protein kinase/formylglycine-generating enzyme family protein [Botrimarina sp.]|uniref:bifunctional serine/threonine-protein kinase/formylglycine-generating enzyme family protein n=1 Tax=Botrimarina sp. TaxID=2795802 RepID=UPI0032EE4678